MSTMFQANPLLAPVIEPGTEPYFDGAREGKLMIKYCKSCSKPHFYPRTLCPFCFGDTEWKQAKGTGTIYSFSFMPKATPNPYCIAYVTLDEGVTMMTQIADCDLATVKIGQKVSVVFKPTTAEGAPVPMFKPI